MKIVNLIENTCRRNDLSFEHGLCFYIETPNHRLLADTGADSGFLDNALKLGVDLKSVDMVFLSHGHYDHCGGVMAFAEINPNAVIYISDKAFDDYWIVGNGGKKYIGINPKIKELPQIKTVSGNLQIDNELFIFNSVKNRELLPFTNSELKVKTAGGYAEDDFSHEQYLEITADSQRVLLSGCAHKGIVNIMAEYKSLRKAEPDAVISGFHTMNSNGYSADEKNIIEQVGRKLQNYSTKFYTCHCTGAEPFDILKNIMGTQIEYIGTGDTVCLR